MALLNTTKYSKAIVTPLGISVGLLISLTACGYKAPVYLPTPEQQQKLDERKQRIEARKQARQQAEQQKLATKEKAQPDANTSATTTQPSPNPAPAKAQNSSD